MASKLLDHGGVCQSVRYAQRNLMFKQRFNLMSILYGNAPLIEKTREQTPKQCTLALKTIEVRDTKVQ